MGTIRVVIAKPGLDGHDRGAKVVARALRDAGVEVIYTGLHQTPEQIVATAIQEDADAVGLSILSGAHMTQFAAVLDLLAERGASDIVVFGGGIVPDADIAELERMGVARIFTPGAPTHEIVDWVAPRSAAGPPSPRSKAADSSGWPCPDCSACRCRPASNADLISAATRSGSVRTWRRRERQQEHPARGHPGVPGSVRAQSSGTGATRGNSPRPPAAAATSSGWPTALGADDRHPPQPATGVRHLAVTFLINRSVSL